LGLLNGTVKLPIKVTQKPNLSLVFCFNLGQGTPTNYVEAFKWFSLASSRNYEGAESAKQAVASHMTPKQFAEATRLAYQFKPVKKSE